MMVPLRDDRSSSSFNHLPTISGITSALRAQRGQQLDIPLLIGGKEVRTGDTFEVTEPHDHQRVLATCHSGDSDSVAQAAAAAAEASHDWATMDFDDRASIFLRAADLLARSPIVSIAAISGDTGGGGCELVGGAAIGGPRSTRRRGVAPVQ